jgi:hypothetical protein
VPADTVVLHGKVYTADVRQASPSRATASGFVAVGLECLDRVNRPAALSRGNAHTRTAGPTLAPAQDRPHMDGVDNACSEPPAGCVRWTLRLLEKKVVEL